MLNFLKLFSIIFFFGTARCQFKDPLVLPGRSVMIHLFEWKWVDIAAECERFLGPQGYAGVQISPPNEHALVSSPPRPWYQRYQPVSYKLISRSGNEAEFVDMVNRCNKVGVRIYVDAVINHMSAISGVGTAGSQFNGGTKFFPAVPYSVSDFNDKNCFTKTGNIENYTDINQVRNCKLVSLPDLATSSEYVRQTIANYLNYLISLGVAGFRIDAVKHMFPADLTAIYAKLNNVRSDIYGASKKPFIYQEVIDLGGEPIKSRDYTTQARVTEFKYGSALSQVILKANGQKLKYLNNFGEPWSFIPGSDAVAFIDNHDNQRGHGGGGNILTFFDPRNYKMATAFELAWPFAFIQLMSSYNFNKTLDWQGPPTNDGTDTKSVVINADGSCGNGWVCEHRWRQIVNMVKFRNLAGFEQVKNWWDNGSNQIAFSRGAKAFIVINNEGTNLNTSLQTGLPAGTYCDIISGNLVSGKCTGKTVVVNADGTSKLFISGSDSDPLVAFHVESKLL